MEHYYYFGRQGYASDLKVIWKKIFKLKNNKSSPKINNILTKIKWIADIINEKEILYEIDYKEILNNLDLKKKDKKKKIKEKLQIKIYKIFIKFRASR